MERGYVAAGGDMAGEDWRDGTSGQASLLWATQVSTQNVAASATRKEFTVPGDKRDSATAREGGRTGGDDCC